MENGMENLMERLGKELEEERWRGLSVADGAGVSSC